MKRILCLSLLLIAFYLNVNAQEFENREFQFVKKFQEMSFEVSNEGFPQHGTEAYTFDNRDRLVAFDTIQDVIYIFDRGFINSEKIKINESIKFSNPSVAWNYGNKYLFTQKWGDGLILILGDKENSFFYYDLEPYGYEVGKYNPFFTNIINNLVLVESNSPQSYFSVEIPDETKDKLIYRGKEDTLSYIRQNSEKIAPLRVKDGFIFHGDLLATTNPRTFQAYFSQRGINDEGTKVFNNVIGSGYYLGNDSAGNYYWTTGTRFYIYNPEGKLIKAIVTKAVYPRSNNRMDAAGNIYYFVYNQKDNTMDLYKLDPGVSISTSSTSRYATSTESRVRVRAAANLQSEILGHLEKGERVEVLEQSGQKVRVGEMEDYWYRVRRLSDGLTGWAYGYFLKREP